MHSKMKFMAAAMAAFFVTPAVADTIDPVSFSADLDVDESVTIRKTVVIEEGTPSDASIDAYFLIDTTGSMGGAITSAKAAAADVFTALTGFGDVAGGVGVFGENAGLAGDACTYPCAGGGPLAPPGTVINQDITTVIGDVTSAISAVTLSNPDGGGSFAESYNKAIDLVADNASWRPGSNRFMFVLGDASSNEFVSDGEVIASLAAEGITLIGLNFGGSSFSSNISSLGGTVFSGGTTPADIVTAVTAGITAGFSEYSEVTVSDLGAGLPEISLSVECISADIGACDGDTAKGDYDRSTGRVFEFDVTFTRVAAGDKSFTTNALVDGGIVAREKDSFGGEPSEIPVPGALPLFLTALGAGGLLRRRNKKKAA